MACRPKPRITTDNALLEGDVIFAGLDLLHEVGPLQSRISGCINTCGHHHARHTRILGLDRAGRESGQTASTGQRAESGFTCGEVAPVIERLIGARLEMREDEPFPEVCRSLGQIALKAALYPPEVRSDAA